MRTTWVMGSWVCLGAIVLASGCAGGGAEESSFTTATVPTTTPVDTDGGSTGTPTTGTPTTGTPTTAATADSTTAADSTTEPAGTTGSTSGEGTTGEGTTGELTTGDTTTDDTTGEPGSSTGPGPACGDGKVDVGEACDDGNQVDTDDCRNTCVAAACGDSVVHAGVETCDDGNQVDTDACRNTCVVAVCGDKVVQAGVEVCDDGVNNNTYGGCGVGCTKLGPKCGDGVVNGGGETCDDGNLNPGDGCDAACKAEVTCKNQGGGALQAENGTGMNVFYCYEQADTVDTRARKACESHFGVGTCCVIVGGYNSLQWGQCNQGGGGGTFHFHPDSHPDGHCDPNYVVGDVVSPGWCGAVLGNFLD